MASRHGPQERSPRLASLEQDYWCLRSAEAAHREAPATFTIPPRDRRERLTRGDAVKLIFDMEGYEEDGSVTVQGERMWVLVTERVGGRYLGVLENNPQLIDPAESIYLRMGAEIAFDAEHVIDIGHPPADYVTLRLSRGPARRWPR